MSEQKPTSGVESGRVSSRSPGRYRLHEPGVVWSLRRDHREYVRTTTDGIQVLVDGVFVHMDRMTARLLARRINECLEATGRKP